MTPLEQPRASANDDQAEPGVRALEIIPAIRVLLAEDEPNLGTILEQFLTARGFSVVIVRDGTAALERLQSESFDVALLDIMMPGIDGLEVLRIVREEPFPPEIIIITGNGTVETAISALKLGAYDFLTKPYRMAEIEALVRRAWEKRVLRRDNARLQGRLKRASSTPSFVTVHAAMAAVLGLIERVASSSSPVLITGESGTGKDLVARLLHTQSDHADGPFVDLNCAALTEQMLEIELFGVERGAFPGADQRKLGLLELATGGTLYLDAIGDLDLKLQAKLVRALESGSFYRVGGTRKVDVSMRVVAATNKDLTRMVAAGQFRDDLLHRINTIRIALPPLRERSVDIAPLADHFLEQFGGSAPPRLSDEALDVLARYRWPGNVRELRNVIERAVLLSTDGVIVARDLPLGTELGGASRTTPVAPLTLIELERRHIQEVLDRTGWHQGRASELLGISPKTLYRKIRDFGFHRPSRFGVMGGA
ncbi:MAG: sigma-54 dependent transcriptional regulator, partial [Gemmatimonadaceae bacterium]